MYRIDPDKFDHAMWELVGRVLSEQNNEKYEYSTKVTFDSGWFKDQEWYKREVWEKAQKILQYETWKIEDIRTYDLIGRITQCMDIQMESGKKQNLLDWRETVGQGKQSLKQLLAEKRDLSEIAIYQIFCGADEGRAFGDAMKLWGAKYPFLSFLFFLKDKDRFVPVRPQKMAQHFTDLGIESGCLRSCSWENYQEFLQILHDIQRNLQGRLDSAAELVDAHSFVWAMWVLDFTSVDPLSLQFESIERETANKELVGDMREALVKVRVNQSVFRERLLYRYKKCRLCGVSNPELLIASHIQPWRVSNQSEKLDVDNGLLLCPNHDQLFDGGWITFDDDGGIVISERLSETDRLCTNVWKDMRIKLTDGNRRYMKYHREKIFKDKE